MPNVRIVLVEDNRDDEELALWSLKKAGVQEVTVARDGVEALRLLLGEGERPPLRPELVLLDLRLPKIDGIEVLQQLRNDERTRTLPVIILTSSEDPHDKKLCTELGALAFLSKPLEANFLFPYL